jgi:hypothetical protein
MTRGRAVAFDPNRTLARLDRLQDARARPRDAAFFGIHARRLKLGDKLHHLSTTQASHLAPVRRQRSGRERLAPEAGCLHVRICDFE